MHKTVRVLQSNQGFFLSNLIVFKLTEKKVLILYNMKIHHGHKRTLFVSMMVKVKLSLCLTKHRAMNAYWGSGGIAPRIL
jgi:hypothetical protein